MLALPLVFLALSAAAQPNPMFFDNGITDASTARLPDSPGCTYCALACLPDNHECCHTWTGEYCTPGFRGKHLFPDPDPDPEILEITINVIISTAEEVGLSIRVL
ncbi:hypothetical protein CcaverHIS641_0606000 [Cutaneotrichosporon cavernicola]|nr:hypothetical protein CcaverHIS641_0606000 [Cutaneotrichosporon cavernicola]